MAASPSRLRQRSGSTPHDALTVDRRSSPHQPLSQPLDRQCTHSCQAINFAPSQIANVASQHHVSSCVAVRAGKTNSQTASIHAHQVSRRGQIPIAFAAPHRTPHRDFVPWRFLVAGRISTWIAQSCRRPKTCTTGDIRQDVASPSCNVRGTAAVHSASTNRQRHTTLEGGGRPGGDRVAAHAHRDHLDGIRR